MPLCTHTCANQNEMDQSQLVTISSLAACETQRHSHSVTILVYFATIIFVTMLA